MAVEFQVYTVLLGVWLSISLIAVPCSLYIVVDARNYNLKRKSFYPLIISCVSLVMTVWILISYNFVELVWK